MASSSDIYFITDPEEWVPPFNFRYSYLLMDDQDLTNAYIFGLPISGHAQQIINAFTNRAQEYSDQIIDAFEKIKFVINIDPELDTSGVYRNSTIHFATSSSPAVTDPIFGGSTAGLMLPLTQVHNGEAKNFRDVWLVEGGEMFQNMPSETVILHEILHALSLKHPQIMGIHILDDRYTVMSYNQGIDGRYNQNLGVLDILAIQSAYSDQINWGANLGSTTYQFSTAAEVDSPEYDQEAIWDAGGGQDIIDASNQTQSVVIDLRQGSLSDIDSIEGRNYNIGIAFGAVIENANGSDQSDVLIGNVASNNITGGDGDDRIFGDGAAYISNGSWLERWSLSETSTTKEEWHYAAEINGANPSSTQTDVLHGGAGDDEIFGGSAYNVLDGGFGDDTLYAAGKSTVMYGAAGVDRFNIGSNTTIADAETAGDSVWMGLQLFGGVKQWWMEGGTAYWTQFSSLLTAFPVVGSELLYTASFFIDTVLMKFASYQRHQDGSLGINIGYGLGGVAKINDYYLDLDSGAASGGVVVFEAGLTSEPNTEKFEQFINLALKAGFGVGFSGWDPIILDLDGDGYELTTQRNSGVYFEFDGDGFAEKTGWVRPDDGFLVLDANNNGIVDDSSEFFGDETQGGFAELATYDLNTDGVIDASDAVFADLEVWRDLNSDGKTDAGELFSLSELGIQSISVAATVPADPVDIGGNTIVAEATVTMADGSARMAGDAILDISHIDTRYLGNTTVSAAAEELPQLRGFGNVADLRVAMSGDATLLSQVQSFNQMATSNLATLKSVAEAILYSWAGVENVAADPIGSNGFDARKLAFLEAFSGQQIAPRDPATGAVQTQGLAELEESWADTVQSLTLRLIVQSDAIPAFAEMTYREDLDLIVMAGPNALQSVFESILGGLPADPMLALEEWQQWGELLKALQDGSRRFDNNLVRDDFVAAQLEAAIITSGSSLDLAALALPLGITNLVIGTSATETLTQLEGGTIFSGIGAGDVVQGGAGQDFYLLARGFGSVTIADEEGGVSGDRVRFVDIDRSEVTVSRVNSDLVITVTDTGDTVTIVGQFADVVPLAADVLLSNNLGVEEVQFADGTVMEIPDIAVAVGEGTAGDDVMHGSMHTDVFQGREGNDLLMGGDDADLYVFDLGDGADIIREEQTTPLLRAADMVIFGDDIAPDDLVFSRGSDRNDLIIQIGDNGDSVTIDNQFSYLSLGYNDPLAPNSRVELFSFRHFGDVYTSKDIQQMLIAADTTEGNDVTLGFGDDDFFGPSHGDDLLIGLDGNDTYYFGRGFGNDAIDEQAIYIDIKVGLGGLSLVDGADTIVFAQDIDIGDVTFSRLSAGKDLTITLDSGETLTVINQFDGFQTGPLGSQWFDRIEWFEFADGTRLSWQDVLLDITTGTDGDDSLWGDLYQDTLTGGLGDDYLSGGGYADTYIYNLGDGNDVLDDDNQFILGSGFVSVDTTPDILRFGAGISSADISISSDPNDIMLEVGLSGETVTLKNQNDYYHTGVFGAISNSRIELIEFADGEVWTWQDLNRKAIEAATTGGDDITIGFDLEDRFEASAGNDILRGGDSNDVYVFGYGSGADRIEETVNNANFTDDDSVEFEPGISLNDVLFERDDKDLIVRLAGSDDELRIAEQFDNYVGFTFTDIENFMFSDGTVVTKAEIMADMTIGTSGNDTITGFHTNDLIIGGLGDDMLYGMDGSDRYEFNLGDGQDTIFESVQFANIADDDRLVFGAGILPADITLSRSGNALILSIDGTTDSVTIDGQFANSSWFSWNDIENFEFADGTVWTKRDVANFLMGGTSGDDVIEGTFQNDEINGLEGNDTLRGGDGADRYYFGRGDGQDIIEETVNDANLSDFDQIIMAEGINAADLEFSRDGNSLVIQIVGTSDRITIIDQFDNYVGFTFHDIERIQFSDGSALSNADIQNILTLGSAADETIRGFHTDDYLDGGQGDDILLGQDGSDTYFFDYGSGNDIIRESVQFVQIDDEDRVLFGADVLPEDVTWSRSGSDLIIGLTGSSDTLTIEGGLAREGSTGFTWRDVEKFDFQDGSQMVLSEVRELLLTPTDGDDILEGFFTNDTISGGAGNDEIHGGAGSDLIVGGTGNDLLYGDSGNDGYFYSIGDGHDTISDYYGYYGNSGDYIEFGEGITYEGLIVGFGSTNADMHLSFEGLDGSITIINQVSGGKEWEIDSLHFADGTIVSKSELANMLAQGQGTSGDDEITGTSDADELYAGAGNDVVNAGAGNDVVYGGADDDTLRGSTGSDRLIGGLGNDLLEGAEQNDVYVYNLGDGDDVINEWSTFYGSHDILELGEGIAPEDLNFAASGEHYIVTFANAAGSITLNRQRTGGRSGGREGGINEIRFANGTVWTRAEIDETYLAQQTTDGNDTILGTIRNDIIEGSAGDDVIQSSAGSDRLIGGLGNDLLEGAEDNDVYIYNLGDGDDVINEWSTFYGSHDILELGVGIAPEDLNFAVSGEHYIVTFANAAGSITLNRQRTGGRSGGREGGVNEIRFANGTVWTRAEIDETYLAQQTTDGNDTILGTIRNDIIEGSAGDDVIQSSAGSDRLIGGLGNDLLEGAEDNDVYIYNLGDGDDVINEWSTFYGSHDILELGVGIAPEDLNFAVSGEHYIVTFANAAGSITLNRQRTGGRSGGREGGINEIRFANGTIWTRVEIDAAYLAQQATDGNDTILGTIRNDIIEGGLGDDILNGSSGTDVSLYQGNQSEFSLVTISGGLYIQDTDTLVLDEGVDQLISIENVTFGDGMSVGVTSPIILDLDGDGIRTLTASVSNAKFDMNGDGNADDISWIGSGDGFLYLDRDGNSTMSGVEEISFIDDLEGAATDLAGLVAFDSNDDGKLDASDERFADFGVWQDANGDGVVDSGETATLSAMGIVSINLVGTPVNGTSQLGDVAIINKGSFTLTNGTTRIFADAALTYFSGPTSEVSQVVASASPDLNHGAACFSIDEGRRFNWPLFGDMVGNRLQIAGMREAVFDLLREHRDVEIWDMCDDHTRQRPAQKSTLNTQRGTLRLQPIEMPTSGAGWNHPAIASEWASRFMPLQPYAATFPLVLQEVDRPRVHTNRPGVLNKVAKVFHKTQPINNAAMIAPDTEIARKVAMIRQDMAVFGGQPQDEMRMPVSNPDRIYEWFA